MPTMGKEDLYELARLPVNHEWLLGWSYTLPFIDSFPNNRIDRFGKGRIRLVDRDGQKADCIPG